jgi:hypothetical protein
MIVATVLYSHDKLIGLAGGSQLSSTPLPQSIYSAQEWDQS